MGWPQPVDEHHGGKGVGLAIAAQAPGFLADGLVLLAVPLLVLAATHSPVLSALSAAPRAVGYLLAGVPAGVLVDRRNPSRLMVASNAARALLYAFLAAATLVGPLPVAAIFAVSLVSAMASVLFETSLAVFIRGSVPPDAAPKAFAQIEFVAQGSLVLGPGIVGLLAAFGPADLALWMIALSYALSFVGSLLTAGQPRNKTPGAGNDHELPNRGAAFHVIFESRVLLTIAVVQVLVSFFMAAETTLVYFLMDVLRITEAQLGLVMSSVGAGGLAGAILTMSLHRLVPVERLLVAGIAAIAVGFGIIASTPHVVLLMAGNALIGLGSIKAAICIRSLRQRFSPPSQLGRVTGTSRTFALAATPVGGLVLGSLLQVSGVLPAALFGISSALLLVVGVGCAWALRPLRRNGQPSDTEILHSNSPLRKETHA